MANVFGYIEVATSNGSRFSDARDGDFLFYTDSNTQSICFGSHDGANAALKITSNMTQSFGYYLTSNLGGYLTNGLNLNLAKTPSPTILCVTPWNSNFFSFNFGTSIAAYAFANSSGSVMLTTTSNNQIQANSNDTMVLPAYTWQGGVNSNTGMYHHSNNQVGFASAGSNVALLTGGGMSVANNVNALNLTAFKNRIMNGDFSVDQRSRGSMVSVSSAASVIVVDRYLTYVSSTVVFSAGQSTFVTPPAGFQYAYRVSITTATSTINASDLSCLVQTRIEGLMFNDLLWGTAAAQPVVFSFWAYSSVTHTFAFILRNNGVTRSYVSQFTCPQNTWTYVTIPIAGDTTGSWSMVNFGLIIEIYTAVGTTYSTGTTNQWVTGNFVGFSGMTNGFISTVGNNFFITGFQMEKGRLATPFEYRPYMTELLLCQRYYYKKVNESAYERVGFVSADNTSSGYSIIPFPTKMRRVPTVITMSSIGHFLFGGPSVSAFSYDANSSSSECGVIGLSGSGFTTSRVYPISTNNQTPGTAWIAFDAEMF